jgi:hypothetical protein
VAVAGLLGPEGEPVMNPKIVFMALFVSHSLVAIMFYIWGRWDEAAKRP